jgi:hypothetical protein
VQSPNVCHALVRLTDRPHTPDQHPTPEPHTGRAFVIPKAVTMPRRPDVPCADCGQLMWRGSTSLPPGQATCLTCRRNANPKPTRWTPGDLRFCCKCAQPYEAHRVNQRYCNPECRPNRGHTVSQRTNTERGYGADHQRHRRAVAPTVDAGQAWCTEPICLMPDRWIEPGTPWDLAHDRDAGPSAYRGPAHARCNRSEGARFRDSREAAPLNRWIL